MNDIQFCNSQQCEFNFFYPVVCSRGMPWEGWVLNFWRVYIITTGPVWHVALFWRIIESHGRKWIYKKERKLINNSVVNLTSAVAMKVSKVRKYWKYSVFLKTLGDRNMKEIRVSTYHAYFRNSFREYLLFFGFVELVRSMDAQWSLFSSKSQTFRLGKTIWAFKFWDIWGYFGWFINTYFGTVSPLSMFSNNQPLFLQKNKPLYPNPKYLFGIGIWIWIWN